MSRRWLLSLFCLTAPSLLFTSSASSHIDPELLTPQMNAKDASSATGSPVKTSPASQTNQQLVRSGLLFLRKKDRYGVWYLTPPASVQAVVTYNVLWSATGQAEEFVRT